MREFKFIHEQYNQDWAQKMGDLLVKANKKVKSAKDADNDSLEPHQIYSMESAYDKIINEGLEANPPPEKEPGKRGRVKQSPPQNLLDRLKFHKDDVLRFIHDFSVPFDNNQGERDVQLIKVKQKVSGTFCTDYGANIFCRIRGYISTVRKNNCNVIGAIKDAFAGIPFIPAKTTIENSGLISYGTLMIKDRKYEQGFSLIELMVVIAIIGTISAIAIPNLLNPAHRVKKAARDLFGDINAIKMSAAKNNESWRIRFGGNGYTIEDGSGTTVKTVTFTDHMAGVTYGMGPATKVANTSTPSPAIPGDGIGYAYNILTFNPKGTSSSGYVYLTYRNSTFALGTHITGVIKLRQWQNGDWR